MKWSDFTDLARFGVQCEMELTRVATRLELYVAHTYSLGLLRMCNSLIIRALLKANVTS